MHHYSMNSYSSVLGSDGLVIIRQTTTCDEWALFRFWHGSGLGSAYSPNNIGILVCSLHHQISQQLTCGVHKSGFLYHPFVTRQPGHRDGILIVSCPHSGASPIYLNQIAYIQIWTKGFCLGMNLSPFLVNHSYFAFLSLPIVHSPLCCPCPANNSSLCVLFVSTN